MRRKVQPHQQSDFSVRTRRGLLLRALAGLCLRRCLFLALASGLGFIRCRWFPCALASRRFRGTIRAPRRAAVRRFAFRPVNFVLHSLVQTERLPPAVQLMARLLGLLLVRTKIESYVCVCHKSSLRLALPLSQGTRRPPSDSVSDFRASRASQIPLANYGVSRYSMCSSRPV
jgi:hypothetical protein